MGISPKGINPLGPFTVRLYTVKKILHLRSEEVEGSPDTWLTLQKAVWHIQGLTLRGVRGKAEASHQLLSSLLS